MLALLPLLLAQSSPLDAMHVYFEGEAAAGSAFIASGAASAVAGGFFLATDEELLEGAAYPSFVFGAIYLAVGIYLHVSSPSRVAKFDAMDAARFKKEEKERLDGVLSTLTILQWVELGLAVVGVGVGVAGGLLDEPLLKGVGVAVAAESLITLLMDLFAHERAEAYAAALSR